MRAKKQVTDTEKHTHQPAQILPEVYDQAALDAAAQQYITPHMLLDMFDEPIVFHRAYVGITGSAVAALFLSYATYASEKLDLASEGWFSKTCDEWQEETGLTMFEQRAARKILREKGILIERRVGMPSSLWFKIRKDALLDELSAQAESRWGS